MDLGRGSEQRYDGRARLYDWLIGGAVYNRLAWSTHPRVYRAFAAEAVASSVDGPILDAGCGTMLLTADAYLAAPHRTVVAVDRSRDMLARARARIAAAGGSARVTFLQGDITNLPVRSESFRTVLCMGMLHLFEDVEVVVRSLRRCVQPGGKLFLSSLVLGRPRGDVYMGALHRSGEIATPRSAPELERRLSAELPGAALRVAGSMAYVTYAVGPIRDPSRASRAMRYGDRRDE